MTDRRSGGGFIASSLIGSSSVSMRASICSMFRPTSETRSRRVRRSRSRCVRLYRAIMKCDLAIDPCRRVHRSTSNGLHRLGRWMGVAAAFRCLGARVAWLLLCLGVGASCAERAFAQTEFKLSQECYSRKPPNRHDAATGRIRTLRRDCSPLHPERTLSGGRGRRAFRGLHSGPVPGAVRHIRRLLRDRVEPFAQAAHHGARCRSISRRTEPYAEPASRCRSARSPKPRKVCKPARTPDR